MKRLTYAFARANGLALLPGQGGAVRCAHLRSAPIEALLEAQRVAGRLLAFDRVSERVLEDILEAGYRDSATEAAGAAAGEDLTSLADNAADIDDLLDQRDDAPVVRLINALLLEAVNEGTSDIHIEIEERRMVVRFRTDGVLRDVLEPRRQLAPLLVSRIKVMGKLDISEKRLPQDGRVSLRIGGYELDVRISTIPSQFGERAVLRLLDRGQTRAGIGELGMAPAALSAFERSLARPDGLVLVTGPTGSGKTTSLYAALDALNDRKRNIMTVEDPIEYSLDGVGQMQVNAATDLTFARGLRAILRQDPDVIMVGEIRDGETARIAVESAMTGHLVLSTLHTNTALGAVARLVDLGVERYLLAPMLRGLIAQRLVRRICTECRVAREATEGEARALGGALRPGETVFSGSGCPSCNGLGYQGRLALYEVVEVGSALEQLIHDGAAEATLCEVARRTSASLLEDGVEKVRAGLTTVADVAGVVHEAASLEPN